MLIPKDRLVVNSIIQWSVIAIFSLAITLPFLYANIRLQSVTGMSSLSAITSFLEFKEATDALKFTIIESLTEVKIFS